MESKAICGALLVVALCFGFASARQAHAAFPGEPGLIAVQRSPDSNKSSEIWVLDWQTGAARQLTTRGYNRSPAFSPNGHWIAFVSDIPKGWFNIWAIRPDGSGLRRLTKGWGEHGAEDPAFSADGRSVAFTAESHQGGREVARVALSGGRWRTLIPQRGKMSAFDPSYSPDGRHLAWVEYREAPRALPHIFIGNPSGRGGRRLTAGSEPEFSPDGHSIVFLREGRCGSGRVGTEIDTLSLDTGQLSHVRSSCGDELDSPTYSPDGGWIAYTVYSAERSEIAFSSVFGVSSQIAPPAGLGADLPVDASPSWQPIPYPTLRWLLLRSTPGQRAVRKQPKSRVAEMSKTAN